MWEVWYDDRRLKTRCLHIYRLYIAIWCELLPAAGRRSLDKKVGKTAEDAFETEAVEAEFRISSCETKNQFIQIN